MKRSFYQNLKIVLLSITLLSLFNLDSALCKSLPMESGKSIGDSIGQSTLDLNAPIMKAQSLESDGNKDGENLSEKTPAKDQGVERREEDIKEPSEEKPITGKSADEPVEKKLSEIEKFFAGQEGAKKISTNLQQFGYNIFKKPVTTFAPIMNVPVGPDYIIGPDDGFTISIWGKMEAAYSVTVDRDGKIIIPEVGAVSVWGLKFSELKKVLKTEIGKFVTDFDLNVTLRKLRTITVFIVGNVKVPGSYTLSSLSSMINALFACGGPTKNGSLRKIQLIRNGKVIRTLDLYDFLLKGDKNQDKRIQQGDTIFIPLIGEVVGVAGNVKRPAIYEMKEKLSLGDLLELVGGVTPFGYLQRVQVERILAHDRQVVIDLNLSSPTETKETALLKTPLQDRDTIKIFPILPGVENLVRMEGHVTRPGVYEWKEGLRISDLIDSYKKLLPEYYLGYAEVIRQEPPDLREQVIPFNLKEMFQKNPEHDLELHKLDRIKIYSGLDFQDRSTVTIKGEIRKPGTYPLRGDIRISTLIMTAGYLTKESHLSWAMFSRLKDPARVGENQFDREFIYIDLAEALKGNPQYDLLLQDRDEIEIFSKWHFKDKFSVKIEGEVRQPKVYGLPENMRIGTLIELAGGLTNDAYRQWAMLSRLKAPEKVGKERFDREFIYINVAEAIKGNKKHDLLLKNHDRLKIYSKWHFKDKFSVTIEGEVRQPKKYDLLENMRISALIHQAGDLTKDVSLEKAEIFRLTPDREVMTISFNLKKALAGDEKEDVLLQNEDRVVIHSIWETKDKETVSVMGQVRKAGDFRLTRNMRVSDLVFRAGGLKENAYLKEAELTRMVIDQEGIKSKLIEVNLEKALEGDKEADILLGKFDSLKIRIIPDWKVKRVVAILGEVKFPGNYNVKKGERLSSLIKRAGGYTDEAYLKGSLFTRESVREKQQMRLEDLINKQEIEIEALSAKITEGVIDKNDLESAQESLKLQKSLLEKLRNTKVSGRVVIKLSALDKFTGSEYDFQLRDLDKLTIPLTPDTVHVIGEVYNQTALLYRENKSVGYYLGKVGGITENANDDEIYVIKADGSVISQSQMGFFSINWDEDSNRWVAGGFMSIELNPGDTILVPRDLDQIDWLKGISYTTMILYQMAIPVGVVASLL